MLKKDSTAEVSDTTKLPEALSPGHQKVGSHKFFRTSSSVKNRRFGQSAGGKGWPGAVTQPGLLSILYAATFSSLASDGRDAVAGFQIFWQGSAGYPSRQSMLQGCQKSRRR
jgi:hypothetical protein